MKTIIFLMVLGFNFYSADLFAQTATDLNCTSCVQTPEIQDNAIKSGKINNAAVTSIKISDGTIVNADISSAAAIDASKISGTAWTSTNDGSGSALDADLLDGFDSAQFLRSDEDITLLSNVFLPEDGSYWIAGNSDSGPRLRLHHSTSGNSAYLDYYDNLYFRSGESSSGTKVTFTSAGNVGIGTTSPGNKLEVWDDAPIISIRDNDGNPRDGSSFGKLEFGSYYGEFASVEATRYGSNYDDVSDLIFKTSFATGAGGDGNNIERMRITHGGNVGIGTTDPGSYKLAVEGTIGARELIVTEDSWSDFVFEDDYQLKPLAEVESFIQQNKHLPDIPSANEVLENGVSVGDMQKRLLQKVEELTLYVIAQDKEITDLKSRINNF